MLRPGLRDLTSLGIEVRYPGRNARELDARNAIALAERIRVAVRTSLGIT